MYAIELVGPDLGRFRRVDCPDPSPPGPGRVLVRMKAASMNFMDVAVATGQYPGVTYPIVPLVDGAGEVIQTGPEVWQVAVGDRVAVHSKPRWIAGEGNASIAKTTRGVNMRGSLIEIADLDAASIVKMPDHLSWEGIAAVPGAGIGAWQGLEAASVGPASTVVLLGTGGVSIFALQFAKARGARVIITSSSDHKLERARALGADETVNYRDRPEWDVAVRSLTDGVGADLVIEAVGGADFNRSIKAVRYGGTIYALGFLGGTTAQVDLLSIIANGLRIEGTNGGSVADLAATVATIAAHRIEPVVDRSFALADLADAYSLMQRGGHFGKIAVTLDW
jgi:NADPH:quinone reductase-like Zn-dependent oxidoreductase